MSPDPLDALRLPIVPIEPRPEFAAALLRRIAGTDEPAPARQTATVRYFVDDIERSVAFYTRLLGFEQELRATPAFAMLYRGDLRLLLSVPGEAHVLPSNRISLRVADLDETAAALRSQGARILTPGRVAGVAVDTLLLEDPSGNVIELFEPRAGYHERKPEEESR